MRNPLVLVLFFLLLHQVLRSQSTFTLDEAVEYALRQSPAIKLANAEISISDAQIMEYKSIGIPKVNAGGTYTYYFAIPTQILPDFLGPAVDGRLLQYDLIDPAQVVPPSGAGLPAQFGTRNMVNLGIDASFMLFDPSFFAGLKAIKQSKTLAARQKENQIYVLKSNVTNAYLTHVYNQQVANSLINDVAVARKSLQDARIFFQNGFLEELDIDRLEFRLNILETELEKMSEFIRLSENLLKYQMNYPMTEDLETTENIDLLLTRFAAQNLELQTGTKPNRPELKILETTEVLRGLQIESTKSGYYPNLRGFAVYNSQLLRNNLFDSNENRWFPASYGGINLSIPIYDGNQRKAQIQNQKLEREKINIQKNQIAYAIQLEIDNARISLNNALTTFANREKNKQLADKIYRTAQVKFKEGVGSSLELTQAESDMYSAQSALLEATYGVLSARFELQKAIGKL
jgi:outer membrane protein